MVADPDPPASVTVLRARAPRRSALPAAPTPLDGREGALATTRALVLHPDSRLVTLTGPGGVGKTRLALALGQALDAAFDGAVWFVDLAPLGDPDLVLPAVAGALGVRGVAGRPLAERVVAILNDRPALLILDNFEHLLAAAPIVADLLAHAAGLRVMATSRAALHLSGEHLFQVPPLALPPAGLVAPAELAQAAAVRLFTARARAATGTFALTEENATAVAAICRRLDGLPLALELAAARSRLLPPPALLERLARRLPLLTGGPRDLPEHQRTLRDTVAWSYDLLTPAEQRLFRRLAVFAGDCSLAAAEAVCAADGDRAPDVLDGVTSLIDKSLLRLEEGPEGEPHFAMLETIREFARERLEESGEAERVQHRHLRHVVALAEEAAAKLQGPEQLRWFEKLERDLDNIRAALTWGLEMGGGVEAALRIAAALTRFWDVRHVAEGRMWITNALRIGADAAPSVRARALRGAAILAHSQGEHGTARAFIQASADAFRAAGDDTGRALTVSDLGSVTVARDPATARWAFARSMALFDTIGNRSDAAASLGKLGYATAVLGDAVTGRTYMEAAVTTLRMLGELSGRAWILRHLGYIALAQGDYGRTADVFIESLAINRDLEERRGTAASLAALGGLAQAQGQSPRAARLLGAATAQLDVANESLLDTDQVEYDRTLTTVRSVLADDAFAAAWAAGRALSLDEAVTLIRETPDRPKTAAASPSSPAPVGAVAAVAPDRLTAREVEVLRLIAAGHSTRAIAAILIISEGIVERHVSNLYAKIGAQNRADATAYAFRRSLTAPIDA